MPNFVGFPPFRGKRERMGHGYGGFPAQQIPRKSSPNDCLRGKPPCRSILVSSDGRHHADGRRDAEGSEKLWFV
jgi:hypothetical protein